MSDDFLYEVDREVNADRERQYREMLRRLWEKYRLQDEELESELFDRADILKNLPNDDEEQASAFIDDEFYNRNNKRLIYAPMVGYPSPMVSNYYGHNHNNKQKRDYPLLPWLPASRKKRFPVAKRSPRPQTEVSTDDKVAKDLKEIFESTEGTTTKAPKKQPVKDIKKPKKGQIEKVIEKSAKDKENADKEKPKRIIRKRGLHDDEMLSELESLWNDGDKKAKRNIEDCDPDDPECFEEDGEQEHNHYGKLIKCSLIK